MSFFGNRQEIKLINCLMNKCLSMRKRRKKLHYKRKTIGRFFCLPIWRRFWIFCCCVFSRLVCNRVREFFLAKQMNDEHVCVFFSSFKAGLGGRVITCCALSISNSLEVIAIFFFFFFLFSCTWFCVVCV